VSKIRIEVLVASTHPMEAYGGVSFPEETIRSLFDTIKNGNLPLGLHHDPRLRVDAKAIDARLERGEDEHLQVIAIYEVDEGDWNLKGGNQVSGFSISGTVPMLGDYKTDPGATIAADAHWFTDAQITAAFNDLSKLGMPVQGRRLYQFATVPPALVVLALQQVLSIPTAVLGAYIYDVLKHFVSREPSKFELNITDPRTGKATHAYLETTSRKVLKHALDTLPALLDHGGEYDYSSGEETWEARE
jgi:hypothetical protein